MQIYNAFVTLTFFFIMKIAIISDVHDHLDNLGKVLNYCENSDITRLICCGDFCSPFVVSALGESGINVYAVFGNNDGDRFAMREIAMNYPNIQLFGEYIGEESNLLEFDSLSFGVTHYEFYARTMVKTGWFEAVFFGHSHTYHKQKYGSSLLMNPGEVAGLFNNPTFAVFDTETKSSEKIEIDPL